MMDVREFSRRDAFFIGVGAVIGWLTAAGVALFIGAAQ
jgi:hypothetical protein